MEILIDAPVDVGGFQFNVTQVTLQSASGGLAEEMVLLYL